MRKKSFSKNELFKGAKEEPGPKLTKKTKSLIFKKSSLSRSMSNKDSISSFKNKTKLSLSHNKKDKLTKSKK